MTPFEIYCNHYSGYLKEFINSNPDASEEDFIKHQHKEYHSRINLFETYGTLGVAKENQVLIDGQTHESRYFTALKIVEFLKDKEQSLKTKVLSPQKVAAQKEWNEKTLNDLWLSEVDKNGVKRGYNECIDFLKKINLYIDSPFVREVNDKLYWSQIPVSGWQQYLAAFIYMCFKNKWIANLPSSTRLVKVLENTFNCEPDVKSYKSLSTNPPKGEYLKPFLKLPANK